MSSKKNDESKAAIIRLEEMGIKKGTKLYTSYSNVSRSGMSRHVRVFVVLDGEIVEISGYVATALGRRRNLDSGGIVTNGCGMNMGFETVYSLASLMFNGEERAGYSLTHQDL